ncbi:MAG: acyl-CoA/acyl-ACP dehydrogenase [Bryobacterales bacterium]|nr:acyl-CoA/acyl-ACP dehydrogenase [Bryobacterales bacterium]
MDFSLTEEQMMLRDSARGFLGTEWPVPELRRMLDPGDAPKAANSLWGKIADLGWPGLLVAEDNGGLGLELFDLVVLMEETGRHLIPGTLHASGVLAALAVETLGNDGAKQRYLPDVAEGSLKATAGIYEPGSGWTAMMLRPQPDGAVTKRYVPEAADAGLILFVNRTSGNDVELAAVGDPEVTNLHSMDTTRPIYQVTCDPDSAERVGGGTIGDLQTVLDKAAIALSAEMVGAAARVLEMTVEYVKNRKQFGRSVGTFQAVQHKAADMLIGIEKARTACYYAAAVADEQPEKLGEAASIAKAAANSAFVFAAETGLQLHGGIGFTWEQDLHMYLKRAKASEFAYGDSKWHLDRIAHLLALG